MCEDECAAEHSGSRPQKNLISAHRKALHAIPSSRAAKSLKASQDGTRPPLATRKADVTKVVLALDGRKQLEALHVAKFGPDRRFGDLGPLSASVVSSPIDALSRLEQGLEWLTP